MSCSWRREGQDVAGRYRVSAVGADAVELMDLRHRRYAAPRPKVTSFTSLIARRVPQLLDARSAFCAIRFARS